MGFRKLAIFVYASSRSSGVDFTPAFQHSNVNTRIQCGKPDHSSTTLILRIVFIYASKQADWSAK